MRLRCAAVVVVVIAMLTACAVRMPPAEPLPPSAELRVGLTEWVIVVDPGATLSSGEATLTVTNTGGTRHDLVVTGAQGRWATPALDPGEQHVLELRARAGETLELSCTFPGHRVHGMRAQIPVAEDAETG